MSLSKEGIAKKIDIQENNSFTQGEQRHSGMTDVQAWSTANADRTRQWQRALGEGSFSKLRSMPRIVGKEVCYISEMQAKK